MSKPFIAGVGMIAFAKPGAGEAYDVMAAKAGRLGWPTPASASRRQ